MKTSPPGASRYLLGPSAGIPMSPRCADKSPWYSREEGRERRRDLLPWRVCKNVNDLPLCFKESTGFHCRLFSHSPPACQYKDVAMWSFLHYQDGRGGGREERKRNGRGDKIVLREMAGAQASPKGLRGRRQAPCQVLRLDLIHPSLYAPSFLPAYLPAWLPGA
ncbi:uncharacterized protein LOC135105079 isoform X1 [Scylla paramamosain]|uniref:uncharacterized protein LOC135105079 isoform X1 n=1 Tax=Scylla paramamosain TaxID=85552 RepID=UPI003083D9B1